MPALDAGLLDRLLGATLPPAIVATMRRTTTTSCWPGRTRRRARWRRARPWRCRASWTSGRRPPRRPLSGARRRRRGSGPRWRQAGATRRRRRAAAARRVLRAARRPRPPLGPLLVGAGAAVAGGWSRSRARAWPPGSPSRRVPQRHRQDRPHRQRRAPQRHPVRGRLPRLGRRRRRCSSSTTRASRPAPARRDPRCPTRSRSTTSRATTGLTRRFDFRPREPGWVFSFRYLGDIDGDGDAELIGGYGDPRDASQALLPFMIDWDGGAGRYRITPLQAAPPPHVGATRPPPSRSSPPTGGASPCTAARASAVRLPRAGLRGRPEAAADRHRRGAASRAR